MKKERFLQVVVHQSLFLCVYLFVAYSKIDETKFENTMQRLKFRFTKVELSPNINVKPFDKRGLFSVGVFSYLYRYGVSQQWNEINSKLNTNIWFLYHFTFKITHKCLLCSI